MYNLSLEFRKIVVNLSSKTIKFKLFVKRICYLFYFFKLIIKKWPAPQTKFIFCHKIEHRS